MILKRYNNFIKESVDDLPDEFQNISDILTYLLDQYSDSEVGFFKNTIHVWINYNILYHGKIDDYISDVNKRLELLKVIKACISKIEANGYNTHLRISDMEVLELLIFKKGDENKYFTVSDKNTIYVNWKSLEDDFDSNIVMSGGSRDREPTLRFELHRNADKDYIIDEMSKIEFNGNKLFEHPKKLTSVYHTSMNKEVRKPYVEHGGPTGSQYVTFYFNDIFNLNM